MSTTGPKSKLERLWQHSGTFCLVIGTDLGHRCGYALVPDSHPDFARFDNEDLKRYEEYATDPNMAVFANLYSTPEKRLSMARQSFWEMKIEVHGGVTFAQEMKSTDWEHRLEGGDGVPSGFWIGFDCAHLYDARDPELLRSFGQEHFDRISEIMKFWDDGHIWTTEEVVIETNAMADQIQLVRKDNPLSGGRPQESSS